MTTQNHTPELLAALKNLEAKTNELIGDYPTKYLKGHGLMEITAMGEELYQIGEALDAARAAIAKVEQSQ